MYGVAFNTSDSSTTANAKPGQMFRDKSGNEWVYVKASSAIAQYDVVTYDETRTRNIQTKEYLSIVRCYYGSILEPHEGPQAFLVNMPDEGSTIHPHFHDIDQFQVIVRGDGIYLCEAAEIEDGGKGVRFPVRAFGASTIFPTDVDGSYEPKNLEDGILDTVWCEGNKTGDGTGEWLDLAFNGAKSVSRLTLRNGNAYNFGIYFS